MIKNLMQKLKLRSPDCDNRALTVIGKLNGRLLNA